MPTFLSHLTRLKDLRFGLAGMLRVQTQLRLVARKFHSFLIRKALPTPVLSSKMLFDGFDGSFDTAFDWLFDGRNTAFDGRQII
jgi:hypothetical protein